jgi:site-specific DNA-cytosine methylase
MEDKVSVIEMGALARGQGNRVWNDNCPTHRAEMGDNQPCVLMDQGGGVMNVEYNKTGTPRRETHGHEPIIQHNTVVRRLTPIECERLQGFPDNYTNIPWANKATAPDSRRYKALGNSMAVPVMLWIGKRIEGAREVVYDEEAIRKVMLPPLSDDEIKHGQQTLF